MKSDCETCKAINWSQYQSCPTCKAEAGKPCEDTWFLTTRGKPVYLDVPHQKRKQKNVAIRGLEEKP